MSLYNPLSEDEVQKARFDLLEDGDYDGVVISAKRAMSKSNNIMADIIVRFFDASGKEYDIRDFLVFTLKMLFKVKHFCDSAGLQKEYLDGTFEPEMALNQHIRAHVVRQPGSEIPVDKLQGKPFGSKYPDKNAVDDYLIGKSAAKPIPKKDDFIDDNIPF